MLSVFNELGAIAEFLPLASYAFLPDRAILAANLQGFASKLIEESGAVPDRLVSEWGAEVRRQTRSLQPDFYDAACKDGRTISLDQVLLEFDLFQQQT